MTFSEHVTQQQRVIPRRVDVVIAGGGLSGLSLAAHLAAAGWRDRKVLVVDDPTAGSPATCWGSWTTGSGLLDSTASQSYRALRMYAAGKPAVLPLRHYRYQLVRRADLASAVASSVAGCPGFIFHNGRVHAVREDASGVDVVIDTDTVRADWVFDSTGTTLRQAAPADAWMAFTGWEVRSVTPVFDPHSPVLFDFRTPQADGARFVYVLPDSSRQALVELTEFVPGRGGAPAPPPEQQRAALTAYLTDVLHCVDFEVTRTESAVLPLRVRPPERGRGRVVAMGAQAGLVKASTGYAYQRIQRDSQAIAASMVEHGHPFDVPARRWRHELLDAVLLRVLERDPRQVELAFARLFTRLGADAMFCFLDEDNTLAQDLRAMTCVQPLPFLAALTKCCFRGRAGLRPRRAYWPG